MTEHNMEPMKIIGYLRDQENELWDDEIGEIDWPVNASFHDVPVSLHIDGFTYNLDLS